MRRDSAQRPPEPPRIVTWFSVTYMTLPPPGKFIIWALALAAVHASGLLPSLPHLPSWLARAL